jgi:hypothetical protein
MRISSWLFKFSPYGSFACLDAKRPGIFLSVAMPDFPGWRPPEFFSGVGYATCEH